jgi:hypothetical protein
MLNLKEEVQKRGYIAAHIKTDSIKIPNADEAIIEFVHEYGREYGYEFEHETTYEKFCLVNDAVYIARDPHGWEATGAQFKHPYVYKKLFSGEDILFDDLCETKNSNTGPMYIDVDYAKRAEKPEHLEDGMRFVGKTGRFVPVVEEFGGGTLYRVKEDKLYTVTGTSGYVWTEAAVAARVGLDIVNFDYADGLVEDALKAINKFGNYDDFVK